jgi:hypothetical protein
VRPWRRVGLNIAEDAEDPTRLKVLGLVLDSSAARAGIKQGDELVAVDGELVRSRSAFQAVSLIQSAAGQDVRVTVRQGGSSGGGGEGAGGDGPQVEERVVTLRRSSSAVGGECGGDGSLSLECEAAVQGRGFWHRTCVEGFRV